MQNTAKTVSKKSKVLLMSSAAVMVGALAVSGSAQADPTNSWDYDAVLGGTVSKDVTVPGITDITVENGSAAVEGNADIYTGHTVNVIGINGAQGLSLIHI